MFAVADPMQLKGKNNRMCQILERFGLESRAGVILGIKARNSGYQDHILDEQRWYQDSMPGKRFQSSPGERFALHLNPQQRVHACRLQGMMGTGC